MKRILVTIPVTEQHKRRLEEKITGCSFEYVALSKVTGDLIRNSEIIVGNVPADYIQASNTLELLQLSAVQNQVIYAAGLDVTDPEPLPAEHPLWREQNILITPHVSGSYHLLDTLDKIVEIAAANIENYLNGKELKNIIDFETGYCK